MTIAELITALQTLPEEYQNKQATVYVECGPLSGIVEVTGIDELRKADTEYDFHHIKASGD